MSRTMKHSKKSNYLQEKIEAVDDFGYLTDKQKREERRLLKKARSKVDRRDNNRYDDDDYDE